MILTPEVSDLVIQTACAYRERVKGPKFEPFKVSLFCLPDDNEVDQQLVLKVHGRGSVLKVFPKPKKEQLLGLFAEDREENEVVRLVDLGEDWILVYAEDLPGWAVARALLDAKKDAE